MTMRWRRLGQGKFFPKNLFLFHTGSVQPNTEKKFLRHTCSAVLRTRKLSVMLTDQLDGKKNWQRQRVQDTRDFWKKKKKKRGKKQKNTVRADNIKGRSRGWGRGMEGVGVV